MKVKELIEILNQCDGESNIGTMSNNHWNDSSHYGSHGTISVVLRNEDIIIGNFNSFTFNGELPYPTQFHEKITKYYFDSASEYKDIK